MQLEQFLYANEIAKCGSITQAAKNLFITQPSLTIAIQKLETELGFFLFNRSQKGVQITEKGEEALSYMQQILTLTENLTNLSPSKATAFTTMQLIAFPMFFDLLDETLFYKIQNTCPNLDFKIIEQTANTILQEVKNGSLNFAISGNASPVYQSLQASLKDSKANNIALQILYQEPLFLLLPENHILLSKETILCQDLKNETFLYFGEHLQKNQLNILEGHDFQFQETIPFYRRTSIKKALLMGQGISIMSKSQFINDPLFLSGKFFARTIEDFTNTSINYLIYNNRHVFYKKETDVLQIVKDFYGSL